MSNLFTQSKFISKEYACEIVRIGAVTPIEGSDFLGTTEIHPGMPIVVRKDEVYEGDVMFYVDLESQLNSDFLHFNNQYDNAEMNHDKNPDKKGFFNKHGRVRLVKLRGQQSMGFLFSKSAMNIYLAAKGNLEAYNMESMVGTVFDTVAGELFVKAYIPFKPEVSGSGDKTGKRNKNLKRFDRIIPGQFSFHYDTDQLEKNIHKISPDDVITVSVKLHGTSAIFSHCMTRRKLSVWERIKRFLGCKVQETEWSHIYSSRTVIKNQYINKNAGAGYYKEDIWGYWNNIIQDYVPQGWTLYCEIVGYTPNGTAIQKGYDYGCRFQESKLMIYRIVTPEGEMNVKDVKLWTEKLTGFVPDLLPISVLYHGTLAELFPHIAVDSQWHANVLHEMANMSIWDMEHNEPLCCNKVPREGVVIRKDNDPLKQAFKLKTMKFRNKEAKLIDAGQVDIEMEQNT